MTITESIIIWLKRFEADDCAKIGEVDTDHLGSITASYGITKAPKETVKRFITGEELHTGYYQFSARLDSQTQFDRVENQRWFEALEEWVCDRTSNKDLPVLDKYTCKDLSISSSYYMGQTQKDNAIYTFTIAIKYEKEI